MINRRLYPTLPRLPKNKVNGQTWHDPLCFHKTMIGRYLSETWTFCWDQGLRFLVRTARGTMIFPRHVPAHGAVHWLEQPALGSLSSLGQSRTLS